MTGFSADWLALREPADHHARDPALVAALAGHLPGRTVRVTDLGCGTGSNLRALAPHLGPAQHWHLVDHDPALLAAARARLSDWADAAAADGADLVLRAGDRTIRVSFGQADLARDPAAALGASPDLVTAAALFDLVSEAWIASFAAAVAERRALFYTALTYDGAERWEPPHPADAAMLAAFHAHQAGDKGFGPSAGPGATAALRAAFEARGYRVRTGDSPWRLGDGSLLRELAKGAAAAVRETGQVPEAVIEDWLKARLAAAACTIGHTDLLALPG
ncbi:MAG TPA: class I SAM-dependent methyltransferase [Microvirga sp.]|jgi:SAM-dependent methyltransferase|nr:class I SAM-dependent methyltransferase [Microvirga sp.]